MSFDEQREISLDEVKVVTEPLKKRDWIHQLCWDAANYIEEHGWIQRRAEDLNGSVCVIAAICHTAHNDFREVIKEFGHYIKEPYIPRWNDAPDRTKEEVIATLRRAADD